jgi:hypothetical protein
VTEQFDINSNGDGEEGRTWLSVLNAVLKARIEQDPNDVDPVIWKAFLLFAFVLVPCIQSW